MAEAKERLRFKIEGKSIVYEGLQSARKKDLMDILAKMAVADAVVVPTFRENIVGSELSDAEVMSLFEDAKRQRRERRNRTAGGAPQESQAEVPPTPAPAPVVATAPPAAAPAPAPQAPPADVAEQKQRLTLSFKGKQFAYEGFPSKREGALLELIMKQGNIGNDLIIKTYRENIADSANSDQQILALLEEAKKAKQAKDEAKRAAKQQQLHTQDSATLHTQSSGTGFAPAAVPHHHQTPSAIDEIYAMSTKEKDVINEFINSVLLSSAPSVAVANSGVRGGDAAASNASAPSGGGDLHPQQSSVHSPQLAASTSMATTDQGPKIAVYCQEEGTTTQRIIYAPKNVSFEDFVAMVEKKMGRKTVLSFYEGEDKVEIDDVDVLQMFLDSQTDGRKLRLICSLPETRRIVTDDKLTEASPGGLHTAAGNLSTTYPAAAATPKVSKFNTSGVVCVSECRTFTGHTAAVYCCAFSPLGDKFCTASRDRSVRVWNTATGTCTTMRGGHNGFVLSCDFSPNGNFVVSSADDCSIKVWNVSTGAKTLSLKGHDDKVYSVQYNATGAYIVSGSCDRTVRVWNADSGARQATLKGHDLAVFSCCFSNTDTGRFVASGSDDRLVKIWDWREGREVKNFIGHTGTVWSVQFSRHDKFLISASMDHELKLWDVASTSCIRTMTGHMTPIHHAIFTPDDKYIISCARDWTVMVWDLETGKKLETLQGHRNTVYHLAMRGDQLLTSSLDDSIKLWNFTDLTMTK